MQCCCCSDLIFRGVLRHPDSLLPPGTTLVDLLEQYMERAGYTDPALGARIAWSGAPPTGPAGVCGFCCGGLRQTLEELMALVQDSGLGRGELRGRGEQLIVDIGLPNIPGGSAA